MEISTKVQIVTKTTTYHPPLAISSFPSVPLITPFARPANCGGIYARDPGDILVIDEQPESSSCYPPGFATDESSFFSPGLACPSGYWSACMESTGVNTITTVTCCPIYRSDVSLSCVDPATLAGVWKSQFCTFIPARSVPVPVTRSSNGRTSTTTSTLVNPGGINAFGIRMVYQSSDVVTASSSSSSSSPSSSTAANLGPDSAGGSGLSTGGTIAIAVVIPVAVIAAIIGFFLLRKSRRARAAQPAALPAQIEENPHKPSPYYDYKPIFAAHQYHGGELPTNQASAELPASSESPVELPAETQRHEMR